MCLGLSSLIEGEEGDASNADAAGDRIHLNLHGIQQQLLERIVALGKPVVLVVLSGSGVAIGWADEHCPAILQAWYPGEEGGTAIADALFGDYNPGGRLPVTWVCGLEQLPPMEDYRMEGRTYRFMKDQPLYPFGWGSSYTTFGYLNLKVTETAHVDEEIEVSVDVINSGERAGDEVAQLYVSRETETTRTPLRELRGFRRLHLQPGETRTVTFKLTPRDLSIINDEGKRILEPGDVTIYVGGCQPDERSRELGGVWLEEKITVKGEPKEIPY